MDEAINVPAASDDQVGPLDPTLLWNECRVRGIPPIQSGSLVIIHSPYFNALINFIIIIASIAVGIETDHPEWRHVLQPINYMCLSVFTLEVCVKVAALRSFFWWGSGSLARRVSLMTTLVYAPSITLNIQITWAYVSETPTLKVHGVSFLVFWYLHTPPVEHPLLSCTQLYSYAVLFCFHFSHPRPLHARVPTSRYDPADAWWNRFDFIVIAISLVDLTVARTGASTGSGGIVVVVRVFRLLRVLRSVRTLKTSTGGDQVQGLGF